MSFLNRRRAKQDPGGMYEAQVPEVGRPDPKDSYLHAVARPSVESYRWFLVSVLLLLVVILMAGALFRLVPLKEVRPWIVQVNETTGESRLNKEAAQPVEAYKPSQAVLDRELFNFVRHLYSLNADAPKVFEESLATAYSTYARDRAAAQVREYVEKEQPDRRMQTIPGLVRTVEKRTITYRADAPVALVRFSTAERQRGQSAPIIRNFAMQVTYVSRPSTDQAELERNPLGLYITHFDTQEER